ncbi:MAG TPA: endonuclease, partial [Chloroflexi bacterium]|nr:endonuclease [Chloroflexota bacterium]
MSEEHHPGVRRLLAALAGTIPDDWLVIVLADRGLYARWLDQQIRTQGWHPFLRIAARGYFAPTGGAFQPLKGLLTAEGQSWLGTGTCFQSPQAQLRGTLLASWGPGTSEPWLILTDLTPSEAQTAWYRLRAWIERFFKCLKRAGWHWEQTKMTDPARAERLWLAIAVATLWVIARGAEAD